MSRSERSRWPDNRRRAQFSRERLKGWSNEDVKPTDATLAFTTKHSTITHGQAKSQEQLALGQRGSQMTCDGHALTNLAVAIRNRAMCSSRGARQRAALLELERYERAIARWTFTPATREQGAAMLDQLLTLQQRVERLKAAALPMKPVVAKAPYAEPSLRVRTTTKLPRARRG